MTLTIPPDIEQKLAKRAVQRNMSVEAILREAGGQMSDVSNEPLQYGSRDLRNPNGLVASNGVVHDRPAGTGALEHAILNALVIRKEIKREGFRPRVYERDSLVNVLDLEHGEDWAENLLCHHGGIRGYVT